MIERVLAILTRTGLLDLCFFSYRDFKLLCSFWYQVTPILKSRLGIVKEKTLDWTTEHAITEFYMFEH